LTLFTALGDDLGLAKAWRRLGVVNGVVCRWATAGEGFERARQHARRAEDGGEGGRATAFGFHAMGWGPASVEPAIARCQRLLEDKAYRSVEAVGLAALANLQAMVGRFDEARRLLVRSDAILEELGQTRRMVETAFLAAAVEMLAGEPAAAARKLEWAYNA